MGVCEICGKKTDELFLAEIEGSKVNVCKECARYGKILKKVKKEGSKAKFVKPKKKSSEEEVEYEIVRNYASIIRGIREKLGLSQEDFAKKISEKLSVLKHIEHGVLEPSLKTARKLEKMFGVKLVEKVEEKKENISLTHDTAELTLGDVIKIKKKK